MAWFHNYYKCHQCGEKWTDDWSAMCDDDCPACGARHISPYISDDLTEIIAQRKGGFVVLQSNDKAENRPDYRPVKVFSTIEEAAFKK
ncbi:hypothetical protein [Afifella sp. YEN Y35]|uniref:hypothetical protein n=1 Tax=Afifella sp. YEN Y35 TaxID=3388337 RepID=UPI0039E0F0DC